MTRKTSLLLSLLLVIASIMSPFAMLPSFATSAAAAGLPVGDTLIFSPTTWDPITFDSSAVTYTLTGFGGAEDSTVVVDPTNSANMVARVVKSATAQLWAGTTVSTGPNNTVPAPLFTASNTTMTVRVWSPDAGIQVRLKIEDAADGTKSVETEATTTAANAWETLTFDFANQVAGTPPLNLAYTYNRISIFFNFGVPGATAGAKTYYFDDVTFSGDTVPPPATWDTITFDSSAVTYTLTGFGGAEDSTVVVDPTNSANMVARVVKSATAELWAGTTVSTGPNLSVPSLPFTASDTTMSVRVWSPDAGIQVRLKAEDAADGTKSVETEATTTVADAWETLVFDFANQAAGTAALNLAYTYNKVSIFFNFGVPGATVGAKTYYFDDVAFGGTPPPPTTWDKITFDSSAVTYTLTGFGGAEDSTVVVDPTNAANNVARVVKSATAELWAGTTVSTGPNLSVPRLPFTASSTTMSVRVWSPDAGIQVRLKAEDAADGTKSVETEATTTVANAWETLTFDFANPAAGTPPLNLANTYNKLSIFFNFGVPGAVAGAKTYYFDDVAFGGTPPPPPISGQSVIIDDFEDGQLPAGQDPDGVQVGFITASAPGASVAITITDAPPAPIPGAAVPNNVLQEDLTLGVGQWAVFVHNFTNDTVDAWVPQDWSSYVGFSLWLYGNNTGGTIFLDILDNRNPGSTTDDAERWSLDIPDNFSGWQFFQFTWDDFNRKDIGNGAPNDGFTLTEVHGYAVGGYGNVNMGSQTYYVDDVGLIVRTTVIDDFEDGQLPAGQDPDGVQVGFITASAPGASVAITITDAPPAPIPGAAVPNNVLQEDLTLGVGQWAVFVHNFTNDTVDAWVPQDWSSYVGFSLWLYGNNTGGTIFLDILDNRNPGSTTDDAERWSLDIPDNFSGWQFFQFTWDDFNRKDIGNGAPNDGFTLTEVHGYAVGGYGNVNMGSQTYYVDQVSIFGNTGGAVEPLQVQFARNNFQVTEGDTAVITVTLNMTSTAPVSINYTTAEAYATPDRNFVPTSGEVVIAPGELAQTFTVMTLHDGKPSGDQRLMLNLRNPNGADAGFRVQAMLTVLDIDPVNSTMLDDFQGFHRFAAAGDVELSITELAAGSAMALPGQGAYEDVLTGVYGPADGSFTQTYPVSQDWSGYNGLSFWYYGSNSDKAITVDLLDNQTTTTAQTPPGQWQLVWSDEFDDAGGVGPNPNVWSHEIGDGTLNGIPGWGNSEREFYTDSLDNAATDGGGNLAITLDQADPAQRLLCWYGPCEYTSARLISANKIEAKFGRIEFRILVPDGADGLWPAFWMLGTNIGEVGWPQSGEIDVMEYVSRNPFEVFGTIHGPGYSGGQAFGRTYTFPQPVAESYHTFSVEWSPDQIRWFVDGINYHNATPADVAPREWVFNHPFYLIMNLAVGGNFGGTISPDLTFPQQMLVDYVRIYQAPNTSERFEASFVDNFSGWRKITVPFSAFTRSAQQPAGAPNDGLGLNDVWGYGFTLPANSSGTLHLDQVQLARIPTVQRSRRFNVDRDTFINGTQPSAYNGSAQTMWVGFFDQMRPVVHVPISGIPNDAEVDLAYLYLYVVEGRGFSTWSNSVIPNVGAHALTTPWMPDAANWWTPWTTAGGDFGPSVGSNTLGSGKIGTWLRLDVTSAVRNTVSTGTNYGFILTSNDDRGVRYGLASKEHWDASKTGYVRVYFRTMN